MIAVIRIESIADPFTRPGLALRAATVLRRAEAMGLLSGEEQFAVLDAPAMREVVRQVQRAGIGADVHLAVRGTKLGSPAWGLALRRLGVALRESPAPGFEWRRLPGVLGMELLARLLGISLPSARRYRSAARTTPDIVAARLHFLSLVTGDLAGAYNDAGIRQWFTRPRAQLGGKSPAGILSGDWQPSAPEVRRVGRLARALAAAPAT